MSGYILCLNKYDSERQEMKEIGGYIELDQFRGQMLHEDAILLNCGRNALAYLLEARKIKKIWLPYFLCDSVKQVCEKYKVKISYYHIDKNFYPCDINPGTDEWIYIVNYYGQISNKYLEEFSKQYPYIIIDHAQSYYSKSISGIDTLYTCRKYFGVSDGAVLYTDIRLNRSLKQDESFERIHYILGRYERTASEFYEESAQNNEIFECEDIKCMSKLTRNLLHS